MEKNDWVLIGKKQYRKDIVENLNQDYIDLIENWDSLDFSKWGSLGNFLVYGSMEALLIEYEKKIKYILSSGCSYPTLPLDDYNFAEQIYKAAKVSLDVALNFEILPKTPFEGRRQYLGRIADNYQQYCEEQKKLLDFKFNECVASSAADSFLRLVCENNEDLC